MSNKIKQELEEILLEYIKTYGMTERARRYFIFDEVAGRMAGNKQRRRLKFSMSFMKGKNASSDS